MAGQPHKKYSSRLPVPGSRRAKSPGTVLHRALTKWIAAVMVIACFCQDVSALACQQRIGDETCDDCRQTACGSNDYCPKPIPDCPCPQMTGGPGKYCTKPMPCITVPAESTCPDDYCSKPAPELCRRPMPCTEQLPMAPGTRPGICQPSHCRSRSFLVVGGATCCQDDYCRKPLPCLAWPQLLAPNGCGADGCPCDAGKRQGCSITR